MTELYDNTVDEYLKTLKWSDQATDLEKTLVNGNIRGFYGYLKERGLLKPSNGVGENA